MREQNIFQGINLKKEAAYERFLVGKGTAFRAARYTGLS